MDWFKIGKQALSSVEDVLLESHLSHCVVNQI